MAAVDIAQISRRIIVITEKQCGEAAVGRVVAKEPVYLLQQALRLFQRQGELAAQIGLQIGHEESSGNSLSCHVGDNEADTVRAETEEVVVIAADSARGDAGSGIFERLERRLRLRK